MTKKFIVLGKDPEQEYHLDEKVPGIITRWCSESAEL